MYRLRAPRERRCVVHNGDRAALLLAPTLSLHYAALLLVPLAIARPTFGAAWLLPLLLWAVGGDRADRPEWQAALTVAVMVAVLVACVWRPQAPRAELAAPALATR